MELINKEALRMAIRYINSVGGCSSVDRDEIEDAISDAPIIDAVEVVHGEWTKEEPYTSCGGQYKKAIECSVCNSFFVSDGNTPWSLHNYCPYCGAKMDKEATDGSSD